MATSTTVVAALKFEDGVAIAADTQATDLAGNVRWKTEKLGQIGNRPIVVGFSGNTGVAGRARAALNQIEFHGSQFKKRDLIRDALTRAINPICKWIKENASPKVAHLEAWNIGLWGLVAFWAEDAPQILELEISGDYDYHDRFHALGSGASTARAIWRTLGSEHLSQVGETKAVPALVRIATTCIEVEAKYVSEPTQLWVVARGQAKQLLKTEIDALKQYVGEWEEKERQAYFAD